MGSNTEMESTRSKSKISFICTKALFMEENSMEQVNYQSTVVQSSKDGFSKAEQKAKELCTASKAP